LKTPLQRLSAPKIHFACFTAIPRLRKAPAAIIGRLKERVPPSFIQVMPGEVKNNNRP